MPAVTHNWKSAESQHRLTVALVAYTDKIDLHRLAELYGQGVTYGGLEKHMRSIKKEAKEMKEGTGIYDEEAVKKRKAGVDDEEEGTSQTPKKLKIRIPRNSRILKAKIEDNDQKKVMESIEADDDEQEEEEEEA